MIGERTFDFILTVAFPYAVIATCIMQLNVLGLIFYPITCLFPSLNQIPSNHIYYSDISTNTRKDKNGYLAK